MDPADFYTGLVAELYAPLRSSVGGSEPYLRFIREHGEPALELGCGDGDPILDLRAAGIDVDGVDSSADMLAGCDRRAAERGLAVTTYCQRMEELDLPRRYASIYVAGGTFTVLPDDATGSAALRAIRAHLLPGGAVLIPLWIPPTTLSADLGRPRTVERPDGSTISVAVLTEDRNEHNRTRDSLLRYVRRSPDGTVETLERTWVIHWYTPNGFTALAADAGLDVVSLTDDATGGPPTGESEDYTAVLAVTVLRS